MGNLLKQYGFLDKIVAALETLIPNKKAILMVLPAVMGILTVPGGAYLSAPFVDKIGDELELSAPRKVVVNLSFRHVALFVMPFTTNMLFIPTVVPEVNIYHLIALNVGFILCYAHMPLILFICMGQNRCVCRLEAAKRKRL